MAVVLIAGLLWSPDSHASTPAPFNFYGSGFGHGVGMSQWGTYGLALKGWSHQQMLKRFFTGTQIQTVKLPPYIRVGLVQGIKTFHLNACNGPVELHVGSPVGRIAGTIPAGDAWVVRVGSGSYRIIDSSGQLVGGHAWGGPNIDLFATHSAGAMVQIQESNNISYNRGYIEFNIYGSNPRGRLIAVLGPQAYLYGLGEVPSSWPMQAMEAQAVAARTYAFEIVRRVGQHQAWCNCAVTDDTRNQVYVAYAKEGGPDGDRWVAAVNDTADQVVTYKGALIQAQYASSDGGFTEDNENVWNGSPLPYLRGVCDPGDYTAANPMAVWTRSMSAAAVTSDLSQFTGDVGTIGSFQNIQRGVSGRIISATVVGSSGHATVSGFDIQVGLGFPSDKVWIDSNKNITGQIRGKYDATVCGPGLATSPQKPVSGGVYQTFAQGAIYFDSGPGAHWLYGPVLTYYVSVGGPAGRLGFPTSDVQKGSSGKTSASFQHGKIVCPSSGTCSG